MKITEALAEIKTIQKRIEKKRGFVKQYLARHSSWRDPMEKEGGSQVAIQEARQSIADLHLRTVKIRTLINQANAQTQLAVEGVTHSVAEWIVWKREIAPAEKAFLNELSAHIQQLRTKAKKEGVNVVGNDADAVVGEDLVVHLSEHELAQQIERHETIMGTLDGQLSLTNATTSIDI